MPISDLCSENLICIERSSSLNNAAKLMRNHHVGGLVVIEANGKNKPVGMLTDRDIVMSTIAGNLPPSTKVENVMSKNPVTVLASSGIADVIDHMAAEGIRRIIVVDDSGNACGLVSTDDVLQLVAREIYSLGQLVAREITNEKVHRPPHDQMLLS